MLRPRVKAMDTYTFTFHPQPVSGHKRCVKSEKMLNEGQQVCTNIMYDPRVIRGNTYALHKKQIICQHDQENVHQGPKIRVAERKTRLLFRPTSPEPVEGRKHIDVQTDLYLQELSDRLVQVNVECYTDAFLDRPATPLFIPAKSGKDAGTQIEEGELFDFDLEVQPVLEVLVGKTVEQALLEVVQEEELADLRARQRAFQELRDAELVEVQRLEEREKRLREEKERRMDQQKAVLEKKRETEEEIAATEYADKLISDLLPSVTASLREDGYISDRVEREIETDFLPWLTTEVTDNLNKCYTAQMVLDMIIQDVVTRRKMDF